MKALVISWKNIKEQIRDFSTLGLSLVIGSFFVLLYWLMIPIRQGKDFLNPVYLF